MTVSVEAIFWGAIRDRREIPEGPVLFAVTAGELDGGT